MTSHSIIKGNYSLSQRADHLTVKAVVDAVNDVVGGGLEGNEPGLVLLHNLLLLGGEAGDVEDIGDRVVGAVANDLAGGGGVHAGHLEVDADVSVVDVDLGRTAEVGDVLVVDDGVGGRDGEEGGGGGTGGLAEELTASGLCVEGGGLGTGLLGHKGGGGGDGGEESDDLHLDKGGGKY